MKRIQKWNGGCAYSFCVVEFCGLPHAHIALRGSPTTDGQGFALCAALPVPIADFTTTMCVGATSMRILFPGSDGEQAIGELYQVAREVHN